jgi:very-short-patch-repair endonuclease
MKFRRQVPIGDWIVDFVSFEHRLVVEADGSQHADCERDMRRDQDLASRGFRILRFWNNEILLKPNAIAEAIFASVAQPPSPGELRSPPSPTRGEGSKKSA